VLVIIRLSVWRGTLRNCKKNTLPPAGISNEEQGTPNIEGSITVEIILERLNAGESVEQIANSYRNIDIHDVHAAVRKK
jgi:hypothetical protein